MNLTAEQQEELAKFPPVLRALIAAELAAGNSIVEVGHSFPAPPAGAYFKLANKVGTRPRASGDGIDFHDRNGSLYSGEFTDAKRFYFILEPPRPPEPEPDLDALRAERDARYAAACRAPKTPASDRHQGVDLNDLTPAEAAIRRRPIFDPNSVAARFEASMKLDYEKWREGTSYDLALLREATSAELDAIERLLIHHQPRDWRDIEALAALGIDRPRVRAALEQALRTSDAAVRMAVHRHAPGLVSERRRIKSLVAALETGEFYGGLSQALAEVQQFHPPEVMDALWRGLLEREGGVAVHFAALLTFLHGQATSPFDWEQRPFFLRFNTENRTVREQLARELRERLARGAP